VAKTIVLKLSLRAQLEGRPGQTSLKNSRRRTLTEQLELGKNAMRRRKPRRRKRQRRLRSMLRSYPTRRKKHKGNTP